MFGRVARKRLFLLSPGHFSLRPRHPEVARSPQSPRLTSLYINELRADESSGLFLTSAGDGNRPDLESGEWQDYRQTIQRPTLNTADMNENGNAI